MHISENPPNIFRLIDSFYMYVCFQVMSLVLASSIAIAIEKNSKALIGSSSQTKKHNKRGLDSFGYDQQEHQEHVYGSSIQSAPVYEVPAPDLAHPIPEPQLPIGHAIG